MGDMIRFGKGKETRQQMDEQARAALAGLRPLPDRVFLLDMGPVEVNGQGVSMLATPTAFRQCRPKESIRSGVRIRRELRPSWEEAVSTIQRIQVAGLIERSLKQAKLEAFPGTFPYRGLFQKATLRAEFFASGDQRVLVVSAEDEDPDALPKRPR